MRYGDGERLYPYKETLVIRPPFFTVLLEVVNCIRVSTVRVVLSKLVFIATPLSFACKRTRTAIQQHD